MRRLIIICAVVALLGKPSWAQKIETQKPDRNRIVHVQTALNHLTVIEVGEPVMTVAAGSSAFKIEWRESKVFIQPTEPSVATNLFIWTASGRLNYELEPAGAVGQMDFAIDSPPVETVPVPGAAAKPPASAAAGGLAAEALLGGRPVRVEASKEPKNRVIVLLKDVFQRDNEVFIRYAVRNESKGPYDIGTPQVFTLVVRRSPQSLYSLANTQLADTTVAHFKIGAQMPVQVVRAEARSPRVEPGEESVGFVGVKLSATHGRAVLRIVFPGQGTDQPTATLVL